MIKKQLILRGLFYLVNLIILIGLIAAYKGNQPESKYIPGVYIGEAEGYHSTITVEVEVDAKRMIRIEVLAHEEPKILADIVMDKIPKMVLKANSTDVDLVAGATLTSKTLLLAIDHALEDAKINKEEDTK